MNNPCLKCPVEIICKEICPFREEYTEFHKKELDKYISSSKDNRNKDFDKKYFSAYIKMEEIDKENKKFYTTISSSASVGSSTSYRSWRRGRSDWLYRDFPIREKRDDYLKNP